MSELQMLGLHFQANAAIRSGDVWRIRRFERHIVGLRFLNIEDPVLHTIQSRLRQAMA